VIAFRREIRFDEVDGANIVFFGRYAYFAHEAMEHFFAGLAGGYPALTMTRKVGFPAVHLDMSFRAPVRYGEVLSIETSVPRLGERSFVLRYRMTREHDGVVACEGLHTVVTCDLVAIRSIPMPADVRALLAAHVEEGAASEGIIPRGAAP
jgi:4-hydroxybenzoyl-CoA thioesterase